MAGQSDSIQAVCRVREQRARFFRALLPEPSRYPRGRVRKDRVTLADNFASHGNTNDEAGTRFSLPTARRSAVRDLHLCRLELSRHSTRGEL